MGEKSPPVKKWKIMLRVCSHPPSWSNHLNLISSGNQRGRSNINLGWINLVCWRAVCPKERDKFATIGPLQFNRQVLTWGRHSYQGLPLSQKIQAILWSLLSGITRSDFPQKFRCWNIYDRRANTWKHVTTQIIATSHDLTLNGGLVREIPLFQGTYYNLARCKLSTLVSVNRW